MPITVDLEEEYLTSRTISISNDSFQQNFTFFICGDFLDNANIDPIYGTDDDLVALEAAYSIIPPFRTVPLYDGNTMVLTLTNLSLSQMDYKTWKVEVSYGVPNQGGQAGGGYAQDPRVPNYDYDRWSENFTQLTFNVSAQQETKTMSAQTAACQKAKGLANQLVPYPSNQPAPMGQTNDGAEGESVYVRGFSFGLTSYFPPSKLTYAYVRRLYRMSTTLNLKTFFGFPKGSVLFLEASASGDVYSVVPVTFDFQLRPNFKFTDIAPTILCDPDEDDPEKMFDVYFEPYFPAANNGQCPGGSYSGWSTVDYRYAPEPDSSAKMVVQKPILRTIHQNYEFQNFDLLGL